MIPMIFWWLCNLQISLSAFRGTVLKNDWAFKASRSVCFDAGRGCLVIANLLGSPAHLIADGRMKANAWDVFFFSLEKRTTFTFPAKFLRFLGLKEKHEPWKKKRKSKQKDDWRSSCPDSESFPFPHQQFVAISHMNGFPAFHEETKLVSSWFDIPFSTEAWFHQREGTVGILQAVPVSLI